MSGPSCCTGWPWLEWQRTSSFWSCALPARQALCYRKSHATKGQDGEFSELASAETYLQLAGVQDRKVPLDAI